MTSVLVTGGAGYIGSHTCKALRRAGFNPITYDNLSRGNAELVKWGPLEPGELADSVRLREVLAQYKPAAVVHFAAFAYVGESNLNPTLYYQNNVGETLALLEALRECEVGKIVFSSSCAVYGAPKVVPISEDMLCAPVNPYGTTKMFCEQMLKDCAAAFPLSFIALRYFNAAGDPPALIADASRARHQLGWRPRYSELSTHMRHTWEWHNGECSSWKRVQTRSVQSERYRSAKSVREIIVGPRNKSDRPINRNYA